MSRHRVMRLAPGLTVIVRQAQRTTTNPAVQAQTLDGTLLENAAGLHEQGHGRQLSPPPALLCGRFPPIPKIYDKYKDKGLSAVWINVLPEENKLIPKWQDENHFTIPVLMGHHRIRCSGITG